jgi:hypothetical protein
MVPQPPQLTGSLLVSVQTLLQSVCPVRQAHALPWQIWPVAHGLAHPPQFLASVAVSVQVPRQLVVPAGQLLPQPPLMQSWPAAHGVKQAPQLFGSAPRSKQDPKQLVSSG